MALSPDARIGAYRVTGQIGAGGMGEVYRAKDMSLDRDVAIKVLPEAFAQDPEGLARFEREAKMLASLNHPNIAQIFTSTIPDKYSPDRRDYDVLPDGRFIGLFPTDGGNNGALPTVSEIRVVLNWFEELKARAPVK